MEDSVPELLIEKEKELQELGKFRIFQLQEQLKEKDNTIQDLEAQILRLHEDFNYNFKLIQERDDEIADLEQAMSSLQEEKLKSRTELELKLLKHEESLHKAQETIRTLTSENEMLHKELTAQKIAQKSTVSEEILALRQSLAKSEEVIRKLECENNSFRTNHVRQKSQQLPDRLYGFDQELVLQIERLKDSVYTKDREINRLQHLVNSIKEERDDFYKEKQNQREINVRLLSDYNFEPEVSQKLHNIENQLSALTGTFKKKKRNSIDFVDSRAFQKEELQKDDNPKRFRKIMDVKSKMTEQFLRTHRRK